MILLNISNSDRRLRCGVIICVVLHCIVLYCTLLHCIILTCIALYSIYIEIGPCCVANLALNCGFSCLNLQMLG